MSKPNWDDYDDINDYCNENELNIDEAIDIDDFAEEDRW